MRRGQQGDCWLRRGAFGDRTLGAQRADRERLRQSQRLEAIGTLSGGIAHDFNNLLSAIVGYAELTRLELPTEGIVAEYVDQILRASRRASELVTQILTFSRRADTRPVPCDIGALVKETLKFLRASLPTSIEIRERVTAAVKVVVDPTQVHQVIMNLGTNAFHAMQEHGGVLEISLEEVRVDEAEGLQVGLAVGSYARLTVSDTGSGIAPDVVGHIFEPYFTTKTAGRGTGPGLSVVHGIVAAAGGRLRVSFAGVSRALGRSRRVLGRCRHPTARAWTGGACEGPERLPYTYGWRRDPKACNIDKPWIRPDDGILANHHAPPEVIEREVERLSKRVPSGSMPRCRSPYGVMDMGGDVDEWAVNVTLHGKPYKSLFKGGHWMHRARNRCRPVTTSHDETTAYYAEGFRCCADPDR
jgi:hypothetical protein